MQSVFTYGRIAARSVFAGFTDLQHQIQWNGASSPNTRELHLISVASGLSKTHNSVQLRKKWTFGDDACFIANHKSNDVVGVADGVGGWRTYGVDPSQFPQSLMATCEQLVKRGSFSPERPTHLLANSYMEVLQNKDQLIGSCTACIVALHRDQKKLYAANLGDSGFMVVRGGEVLHRSEEQQHYFNTPFQLSVAPSDLQGMVHSDSPDSAETSELSVRDGDLILLGTDGLFDNMNEEMILAHLRRIKDARLESLQKTADSLTSHANELAMDPDYMSPFAQNATANGYEDVKGGKPDDITVVLARVTECDQMEYEAFVGAS